MQEPELLWEPERGLGLVQGPEQLLLRGPEPELLPLQGWEPERSQ